MTFQSYTHCVRREDYQDPLYSIPETLSMVLTMGLAEDVLEEALDYLLDGKLVCLDDHDRCAIGQIISFESPADKSFPGSVDNDFSINLMLFPNTLNDFLDWKNLKNMTLDDAYQVAKRGIQGELISEQPGMPRPFEGLPFGERYVPYPIEPLDFTASLKIGGYNEIYAFPTFYIPVLHLECEGSRINDLHTALENLGSSVLGGTGLCDLKIFGLPFGRVACKLLSALLTPLLPVALAAAWFNARDGNKEDPRTATGGDLPGELQPGNLIVVTGRWAYDAGHQGWNELHPVKKIIKVSDKTDDFHAIGDPKEVRDQFCTLALEAPPPNRDGPGGMAPAMNPAQQGTWENQLQPEHRWVLHPLIDGCQPPEQPPATILR